MIVAVAGCVAQAEGGEIVKRAPYVDMVFGPQTYHRLPEMIAQATREKDRKDGKGRPGILDVDFPVESKFESKNDSLTQIIQINPWIFARTSIRSGTPKKGKLRTPK